MTYNERMEKMREEARLKQEDLDRLEARLRELELKLQADVSVRL